MLIKFGNFEHFTAGFFQSFFTDCTADRAIIIWCSLFLSAAADPEFLLVTILFSTIVHIAESAVGALDLSSKAADV